MKGPFIAFSFHVVSHLCGFNAQVVLVTGIQENARHILPLIQEL